MRKDALVSYDPRHLVRKTMDTLQRCVLCVEVNLFPTKFRLFHCRVGQDHMQIEQQDILTGTGSDTVGLEKY